MTAVGQLIKQALPERVRLVASEQRAHLVVECHKRMTEQEVRAWLQKEYKKHVGEELDLDHPRRYTEKIQWRKLHAMDKTTSLLADKYVVRPWVAERIGEDHLVPLLGVWDDPRNIDFDALPQAFVLKTNNASGTNILVPNKARLNEGNARRRLKSWLGWEFGWAYFESQYMRISPKLICEQYLRGEDGLEPQDYKVLCFDGKPHFVWVDMDRYGYHTRAVFDTNWRVQPWIQYFPMPRNTPRRPEALMEMLEMAESLAVGFAHVRIDFYIVGGKVYFGEMTFSNGSGFERITPMEWDYRLGSMWNLDLEPHCEFPYGR